MSLIVGNPVLLVIDIQKDGLMPEASGIPLMPGFPALVERSKELLAAARRADVPAIFVLEEHRHSGIGLLTPPVGAVLFVGCAVGKVTIEQVMRTIWPFYGVMFAVLMLVTFIPALSLWLPALVIK